MRLWLTGKWEPNKTEAPGNEHQWVHCGVTAVCGPVEWAQSPQSLSALKASTGVMPSLGCRPRPGPNSSVWCSLCRCVSALRLEHPTDPLCRQSPARPPSEPGHLSFQRAYFLSQSSPSVWIPSCCLCKAAERGFPSHSFSSKARIAKLLFQIETFFFNKKEKRASKHLQLGS